jgi:hypothetical protein
MRRTDIFQGREDFALHKKTETKSEGREVSKNCKDCSTDCSSRGKESADAPTHFIVEILEATKARTYAGHVCRHCGDMVKRGGRL